MLEKEARLAAKKEGLDAFQQVAGTATGWRGVVKNSRSASFSARWGKHRKSLGSFASAWEAALHYARHVKQFGDCGNHDDTDDDDGVLIRSTGSGTGWRGVVKFSGSTTFTARYGKSRAVLGTFATAKEAARAYARHLASTGATRCWRGRRGHAASTEPQPCKHNEENEDEESEDDVEDRVEGSLDMARSPGSQGTCRACQGAHRAHTCRGRRFGMPAPEGGVHVAAAAEDSEDDVKDDAQNDDDLDRERAIDRAIEHSFTPKQQEKAAGSSTPDGECDACQGRHRPHTCSARKHRQMETAKPSAQAPASAKSRSPAAPRASRVRAVRRAAVSDAKHGRSAGSGATGTRKQLKQSAKPAAAAATKPRPPARTLVPESASAVPAMSSSAADSGDAPEEREEMDAARVDRTLFLGAFADGWRVVEARKDGAKKGHWKYLSPLGSTLTTKARAMSVAMRRTSYAPEAVCGVSPPSPPVKAADPLHAASGTSSPAAQAVAHMYAAAAVAQARSAQQAQQAQETEEAAAAAAQARVHRLAQKPTPAASSDARHTLLQLLAGVTDLQPLALPPTPPPPPLSPAEHPDSTAAKPPRPKYNPHAMPPMDDDEPAVEEGSAAASEPPGTTTPARKRPRASDVVEREHITLGGPSAANASEVQPHTASGSYLEISPHGAHAWVSADVLRQRQLCMPPLAAAEPPPLYPPPADGIGGPRRSSEQ